MPSLQASKFARHATHERVLVYHPIKELATDELWHQLFQLGTLPWGVDVHNLFGLYAKADKECPLTADGSQAASCGGGRRGCVVCGLVGKRDPMLINLVQTGDESLIPVLEFKHLLLDMRNDVRYRKPMRCVTERKLEKTDEDQGQISLFDAAYQNMRIVDGWEFKPGSLTVEGRRMLLEQLLYTEQQSGHKLIQEEEIMFILDCWLAEGLLIRREELTAKNHFSAYDGPLVLNPDGSLNTRETKVTAQIFALWEPFDIGQEEILAFFRERTRKTGRHLFFFMSSFELSHEEPVNSVQFLICKRGINTITEARSYLDEWLGFA